MSQASLPKLDHAFVERTHLLERYRARRLSEADADAFEIHYLECETCRSALEADDALSDGFKAVAAEAIGETSPAAGLATARPHPAPRWLAPYAAAASVLLVVLAGVLGWNAISPPSSLPTQVVPVFTQRDAGTPAPVGISIRNEPELLVFILDAIQPELQRYDVAIVGKEDRILWSAQDIAPRMTLNAERLTVSVPSATLDEGGLLLRVTGKRADGTAASKSEFPIRVTRVER